MTTLTPTASNASNQTKFFTVAQLPDPARIQLAAWEAQSMQQIAPGVVILSRSATDSDAEILDDLVRWLGTTGATVAGPFPSLLLAAASQRLAA